jgi:molecular chaperone DnaK
VLAGGAVGGVLLLNKDKTNNAGSGGQPSTAANNTTSTVPTTTAPKIPPDEQCTDEIKANPRWVCLTSAVIADGKITIKYTYQFGSAAPNVNGGFHIHIYGGDGTSPADSTEGTQAPPNIRGHWYVEDRTQSVLSLTDKRYTDAVGPDAVKVCARIATAAHQLVPDKNGGYKTGNCVPIVRQ